MHIWCCLQLCRLLSSHVCTLGANLIFSSTASDMISIFTRQETAAATKQKIECWQKNFGTKEGSNLRVISTAVLRNRYLRKPDTYCDVCWCFCYLHGYSRDFWVSKGFFMFVFSGLVGSWHLVRRYTMVTACSRRQKCCQHTSSWNLADGEP